MVRDKEEKLFLAVCNLESLDPEHRKNCEHAERYVTPLKRYVDRDGVIHDPFYHLPTHNPENYTASGMYRLKFIEQYKNDPDFRERMKLLVKLRQEPP